MLKQSRSEKLAQQATFIFKGIVKKLKASTIPSLPVNEKTIVMRVDEILRAPEALAYYKGQDITVQLGSRERIKKGEQAIFYTNSLMVGESLAVQSVGHTAVGNEPAATTERRGRFAAAASNAAESDLQERVANADAVVTGRVTSVRVLDEPGDSAAGNVSAADQFLPISEHSPVWQEAVIEVADVEKGANVPREIVVRFPTSTDVMWHDTPKLKTGQEGVFLLQKESKKKTAAANRISVLPPPAQGTAKAQLYTALGAAAVQPLQQVETIRTLLKAAK